MQALEWTFIDKSDWPEGPWHNEPDKKQWRDPATGLPCLMVRNRGNWCGYVGVPPDHPAYGKEWDSVDVDVHGGLTFAGQCQPDKEHGICHVVEPGESDDVWWLGFDCAHCFDLSPDMLKWEKEHGFADLTGPKEVYRDAAYVEAEVSRLASQLKK